VIVLRGEAGVGKTALLEYVAERAVRCRVLRTAGVASEMELAFAGLHQLSAPILDGLERLAGPQRDALRVAFGLQDGGAPDRFLVALATLSLLADAAERQPHVCLVDDAQWLDRASAQALAFVARRLFAERIAMVFAVRGPSDTADLAALPELVVEGIADDDARALLGSAIQGRLDERVRDRIVAETRGNPLALLELPRGLAPAELAGGFGLPDALPPTRRIEQRFVDRISTLPPATRRLLLAAAAEPIGDAALLWRAAGQLGIGPDAAGPAETEGLMEVGVRVRFRHPLVRSAVYHAASLADRRRVHRALAEATDPVSDPDRRAWHRASAAIGLDEAVAVELERSAGRAQNRGGIAAAAAFLARATALTPDPAARGARALAAAQAKFEAASSDPALELLATAEIGPLDEHQRARLARLRAQITFVHRRGSDAPPLMLDAAKRLEPLDAELARETYLEALGAAIFAGRLGGLAVLETAEAARAAPRPADPPRAVDLLLDGLAMRFTEGYVPAVPLLRRALLAFTEQSGRGQDDMRWLWLACRIAPELWDDGAWHVLATRAVRLARDVGALTVLPIAATYRAGVHVHAGEFDTASELIEEADSISEATGNAPMIYTSLVLPAWVGRETGALELIEAGVRDATARGEGRSIALAEYVTAVLYNGLGRYEEALAAAQRACEHDDLGLFGWALIELVEAGARSDRQDIASDAVQHLEERTRASGTDWALGIQARSRALLSDGSDADALYGEAVERLARTRIAVHLARAHLVYGEWLRRENRRVDAREQLRAAHDMFSRFGAEAFAERARRELMATGETARQRNDTTRDVLTPQEAQIARMARAGHTNPEIAAQLFLSPRTVEYHLHKVFTKLGIGSRKELRRTLPDDVQTVVLA
jgi:DNA-binding CsgD family transcriptional regulator/tetratricopeptide (TPR) repeat protein